MTGDATGERAGPATDPLSRARSIRSPAEARRLYADWATGYDDDVFGHMGVTGSRRVADLFAQHVGNPNVAVVDLGCGTGAVGRRLAELGFTRLVGLDLSPEMLSVAAEWRVYDGLVAADLHAPPIMPACFDGSVSAGTFTTGHLGAAAARAVLPLLRSGSRLVWSVAPEVWPEISEVFRERGVSVSSDDLEAIRSNGADRSHMGVAVVGA